MKRLTLIALALTAWPTAVAEGRPLGKIPPRLVAGSLAEARHFWHERRPLCGRIAVRVEKLSTDRFGDGDPRTCVIRLDRFAARYFDRPFMCTVLVHEYGHLLGFAHDSEHRSVMRTGYDRGTLVKGCARRFDALWAYEDQRWAVSSKRPVMLPNSLLPYGVTSWWD